MAYVPLMAVGAGARTARLQRSPGSAEKNERKMSMEVYEIIGKLLAAFVVGLVAYLVPKARAWFVANTDKTTQGRINQLVTAFARAAEQLFHDTDPSGAKRQQFVREQLSALGIEITEAVINMIEGAVWEINMETKKAQVQTKEIISDDLDALEEAVMQEVLAQLPGQTHE